MIFTACAAGVLALLLRIGVSDWRYRRIRNRDVALVAAGSIICFFVTPSFQISSLALSFCAALTLTLPGFFSGHVGAGDVKLFCALAPLWSAVEFLAVFVIGIFLLLPLMITRPSLLQPNPSLHLSDSALTSRSQGFPLGTAIALGSLPWFVRKVVQHV